MTEHHSTTRVAIWTLASDRWLFEGEGTLGECFPDDPVEQAWAWAYLDTHDEYTTGGGAAPIFKLLRI